MFHIFESIILILFIIVLICIILLFKSIHSMSKQINTLAQTNFILFKRLERMDTSLNDLSNMCDSTQRNITSLSTSIDLTLDDIKRKSNEKYYPTPELARMIEETIREQVTIEVALIKNMRIPKKLSIENIVNIVSQTYPHISVEYIAKKTVAFIESISPNNQQ